MKFFVRFFAVVLIIVGLAIAIYHIVVEAPKASERLEKGLSATFVDKHANNNSAPAPSGPSATPVDFAAVATQASFAAGVELTGFVQQGNYYLAEVRWQGANAAKGGDFLDALVRSGHLANFEEIGNASITKDKRGANVYQAQFKLFMR
ncbi:MAG: hypothetical protein PWP23_599 [Candidatus Sumerlaeota bacterium]|nr:hypothetical protein [Candidatus Sumerlaeota bacterium]